MRLRITSAPGVLVARRAAAELTSSGPADPHSFHTLVKIGLARLKHLFTSSDDQWNESEISRIIWECEQSLQEGLQQFPEHEFLLDAEAQFAELLTDDDRVIAALSKAFETNPTSAYIASRLAKQHGYKGDTERQQAVLERALESGSGDKQLNYMYARLLIENPTANQATIEWHLRRAFTEGDRNFDAQFWYARQLYINGKTSESYQRFSSLRTCPIDPNVKNAVRGILQQNGEIIEFSGQIARIESTYAFLLRDGSGDRIFVHVSRVDDSVWRQLSLRNRVRYSIGFNFGGPSAADLRLE